MAQGKFCCNVTCSYDNPQPDVFCGQRNFSTRYLLRSPSHLVKHEKLQIRLCRCHTFFPSLLFWKVQLLYQLTVCKKTTLFLFSQKTVKKVMMDVFRITAVSSDSRPPNPKCLTAIIVFDI